MYHIITWENAACKPQIMLSWSFIYIVLVHWDRNLAFGMQITIGQFDVNILWRALIYMCGNLFCKINWACLNHKHPADIQM